MGFEVMLPRWGMAAVAAAVVLLPISSANAQRLIPVERRVSGPEFVLPVAFSPTAPAPDSLRLAAYRGAVIVLDFWAPWCVPCAPMHEELVAMVRKGLPAGVSVISVAMASNPNRVQAFLGQHATPTFPVLLANGRARDVFDFTSIPAMLIIDREGRVAWRRTGAFDVALTLPHLLIDVLADPADVKPGSGNRVLR